MDGYHDVVRLKTVSAGDFLIVDFTDRLNLEIVVAGAKRPHLAALAPLGLVRHA